MFTTQAICLCVCVFPGLLGGWGGGGPVAVVGVVGGHPRFSRLPFVLMKTNVAVGRGFMRW